MNTFNVINIEKLIAIMPGHVYWLDRNNIYQGCNDLQAKSLGLSSRFEVIGKKNSLFTVFPREMAELYDNNNLFVMNSGIAQVFEEATILENGNQVVMLSQKIPIVDDDQKVIGLLGLSVDITELKNRENELREKIDEIDLPLSQIVTQMPGHVYWKNKDGVYLGCNNRQAQTIGLKEAFEIIGKTDFDLPWGYEAARICRENDIETMKTDGVKEMEETATIDGNEKVFLSQKKSLKNKNGEVVGVLGISVDITRQKEAEMELKQAKEAAESANVLKSEFIYNMEHDIRTPFSGIIGMTQILEQLEKDPDKKQIIRDIQICAKELLDYSCSILDYSKIEAGIFPISNNEFDFKKLINSIKSIELPAAAMKQLTFSIEYDPEIPPFLIGDDYRLSRVLINLVSNAIKFTNKGFVRLTVKCGKINKEKLNLEFYIEDSGIGIAADKLGRIYEKFTRLQPANQGNYKGVGLGLRIVKKFVEDMEGQIEIRSTQGEGTCFICKLNFGIAICEATG